MIDERLWSCCAAWDWKGEFDIIPASYRVASNSEWHLPVLWFRNLM